MALDLHESVGSALRIAASCNGRMPVLVTMAADQQGVQRAIEEHVFDHALCQPLRVAGLLGLIDETCADYSRTSARASQRSRRLAQGAELGRSGRSAIAGTATSCRASRSMR